MSAPDFRSPIHVLHVFKDFYPPSRGGVEQHIHDIVHSLEHFEFTVLTSSRTRRTVLDANDDVPVIRAAELFRPVSTPVTPSWVNHLRSSKANLAHFHMPNPFGELCFLLSGMKAPMMATYHADIVGRQALLPFFRPFQQRFLARATKIVVGSRQLLESSPALARHQSKAVIIPYGVDPTRWATRPPEADRIKERYPGSLVLFLGRVAYYKGLDVLVRSMEGVEATCLLIGNGPLRESLARVVNELDLAQRIIFVGEVPDDERAAYYHAADLFVLPSTSRAESFGIAMLEAMACGTPAISTELGTGTSWVNQHDVTGLVVPPNDPAALAVAIKALLEDEGRIQQMGYAAAARASEIFTRERMLSLLEEVYRSL